MPTLPDLVRPRFFFSIPQPPGKFFLIQLPARNRFLHTCRQVAGEQRVSPFRRGPYERFVSACRRSRNSWKLFRAAAKLPQRLFELDLKIKSIHIHPKRPSKVITEGRMGIFSRFFYEKTNRSARPQPREFLSGRCLMHFQLAIAGRSDVLLLVPGSSSWSPPRR